MTAVAGVFRTGRGFALLLVAVTALALAYQVKGHYLLVFGDEPSDAIDLKQKWSEHRYFLERVNPYDVWLQHGPYRNSPVAKRTIEVRGAAVPSFFSTDPASPPWGYLPGLLWYWPNWPGARGYFSALNVVAGLVIAIWAYRTFASTSRHVAALLAVGTLAFGAACTALEIGQYTILIAALLVCCLAAEQAGLWWVAGIALTFALAKPTISVPFAIALFVAGRWKTIGVTSALCLVSSAATAWAVRTNPLEMLSQLSLVGQYLAEASDISLPAALIAQGHLDPRSAILVSAVGSTVVLTCVLIAMRHSSLLLRFGVASVAGRIWTYHRSYDDPMLVFLLAALVSVSLVSRRVEVVGVAVAVFLTLAVPPSLAFLDGVPVLQVVTWLVGAAVVVVFGRMSQLEWRSMHETAR